MMIRADICIIGGGIVGLATAYRHSQKFPKKSIVLLEKENLLAAFILEDKSPFKNKLNSKKIKLASESIEEIEKSLLDFLQMEKFENFTENVKIKAGQHFISQEACIKFFFNQVIFNLFESKILSDQQSKNALIYYCKKI